jgi:hypothetical protein
MSSPHADDGGAGDGAPDGVFERTLLESARDDAPSGRATRLAWERFALSLAAPAAMAAGGGALGTAGAPGKHAASWAAAKWALIGAIGGSSLTAVLMSGHGEPPALPAPAAAAPAITAITGATSIGGIAPAVPVPEMQAASGAPAETTPPIPARRHGAARARPVSAIGGPSTLAAEVSLLDAARTALATGAADDALRLIAEYRRTFPAGELAADAEVVAIDALASKDDPARAGADGERFLKRYPNDPHAEHVRAVVKAK